MSEAIRPPAAESVRRDSWLIYLNLAIVAVVGMVAVMVLTRASLPRSAGRVSDTSFDFAYRDPAAVLRNTDRIIVDADVTVALTPHADRPDSIAIAPGGAAPNAVFTWTLVPELGSGGPTQLAGEIAYQGVIYRLCEAIIGDQANFPPDQNRLYAERYFPFGNEGRRARTPQTVDPAPFVAYMRDAIAQTAGFEGGGGLPAHELRLEAGSLIGACSG